MGELMVNFNAQMAGMSVPVHIWMNWMLIVFLMSLAFVYRRKSARVVFWTFLASMPVGLGAFYLTGSVHMLGVAHFLLWGPLLNHLYKRHFKPKAVDYKTPFGIWLSLLSVTIVISLLFDARDIVLVLMGAK